MAKFSMNQMTTMRWSFEQDCFRYREAGLASIHVWREILHDFGEAKGATLLEELGLEVSALSWAGGFTGSDGRNFDDAVEDAKQAIQLAEELHAGCLVIYSGARAGHINKHAVRVFMSALEELVPFAEAHRVCLAIKPIRHPYGRNWTFLRHVSDALKVLEVFHSPNFKMVLDLYEFADQKEVINHLPGLIPHLALVQFGDRVKPPREEPNRRLPGSGSLPLEATMTQLMRLGYRGAFDVELMGSDVQQFSYEEMLSHSVRYWTESIETTPQA